MEKAVLRARQKAGVMAAALGRGSGAAVQINEQGVSIPQPIRMQASMEMADMSKSSQPDAFAGGEIEVSASVTVVFALIDTE